ncbi:hypothetical protein [Streptomyces johnsoniae]|uniref:AMP-binding enzyme C-terminal domain-containing protein n=1 Tax=Streptomyces johnsoniae TaxID=3075532 RepID=A0ABU2RXC5_9ACTN|nr:hypothetical protein [Streptomyces sp. DSM 41886]MDT0441396.1 hypothetical protein [Streptomyces sp. DSM 41886]
MNLHRLLADSARRRPDAVAVHGPEGPRELDRTSGSTDAPKAVCTGHRPARRLPTYMIVDRLSVRAELPRTPNGKLDRRLLLTEAEAARS